MLLFLHIVLTAGLCLADALIFLCLVTDMLATVAPIGVKFCIMVHISPGQIFSPLGAAHPGPLNPKFSPFDRHISKTVKSQHCQLELNVISMKAV